MTGLMWAFLTLVSLFIGFPKSHSTWEPLVFAWHLICKRSRFFWGTNDINTVKGTKSLEVSAIRPEKSKPAVGFLSLSRTEWVVE